MTTRQAFYREVRGLIAQACHTMWPTLGETGPAKNRYADRKDEQRSEHVPTNLEDDNLEDDAMTEELRRKAVQSLLLMGSWRG